MPDLLLSHTRYEPGPLLGRGGQGTVLRVVDREDRAKALVAKIWTSWGRGEGGAAKAGEGLAGEGVAGEFALLSRSRIPGLVRAHDLARDERTRAPFLVEQFVDGVDALEWVEGAGERHRSERLAALLADVGATLAALHALGFVHGDLKPAHVRIGADGRATLLDLGSAVRHAARRDPGAAWATTRGYAAPEVLAGAAPSPASDLYGLGAVAWKCCAGQVPDPRRAARLRELAPWVQPKLADVVERLIAPHPRDRPERATALLELLGRAGAARPFSGDARFAPLGRERLFESLLAPSDHRVRYLAGPSGAGKSHLARAIVTAALVRGRSARLLGLAEERCPPLDDLLAYLRGDAARLPFRAPEGDGPLLLVVDDLAKGPAELAAALDLYRCGGEAAVELQVLATAREAPAGAPAVALETFDDATMTALLRDLGVHDAATTATLLRSSAGNPGVALAWLGRIPLTKGAVLERAKSLSALAVDALASVAVAGGALSEAALRAVTGERADHAIGELLSAALLTRAASVDATYALTAPHLAGDLAGALGSFEIVDRVASAVLAAPSSPAPWLAALAFAPNPPSRRAELLRVGAARAREEGRSELEMDLCFALAADPAERGGGLLTRLERLARDTGRAGLHPQVLDWLERAAADDPALAPLTLRRRAEARARAGDHAAAHEAAAEAQRAAAARGDAAGEALALATAGVVALYRADWGPAERALTEARRRLPTDYADQEELARLEHNFGVVALYRGHLEEAEQAFLQSLARKRRLGDRAGVRACLLNLGIAQAKLERLDGAESALEEAMRLAEALGQVAGLGWCLTARADVEVRRKNPAGAERRIAEAEALGDAIPSAVRADLVLLRAAVHLLEGDGSAALTTLAGVEPGLREGDPLIDARASVIESRAYLLALPADRRRAARAAIRAARRARTAELAETEREAIAALRASRARPAPARGVRPSPPAAPARETAARPAGYDVPAMAPPDDALWGWLRALPGLSLDDAGFRLARLVVHEARAERAFVALIDGAGRIAAAWGADIDDLPIAEAAQRLPLEEARIALRKAGPVSFRDRATPLGLGSLLAAAGPGASARGVIVVEHRSAADRFDGITADTALRWSTLAGVLARPPDEAAPIRAASRGSNDTPVSEPLSSVHIEDGGESTTALPFRAIGRSFPGILGESPALRRALAQLDAAIDTDLPVLVVGETGTGKELFARALHELGPRARAPFIAVNCGSIPESLFETEFFGHARGSFTGADRARRGLLARADRGTLLLDEVGELPAQRQASLLRALETQRFRPVGSDEEIELDVRFVAATHRDLARAVDQGTFRRDLLFRLNVVEIRVPPLRDREGDVALLARHFLAAAGSRAALSAGALEALAAYGWPGNVRELEHQMQRLAVLPAAIIERAMLPRAIRAAQGRQEPAAAPKRDPERERGDVERALAATGGNISHAAERLGLTRHGLKKRMERLGLRKVAKR